MKRAHAAIALYALLAALVVPVYPHFASPNEFTRWALARAIVDGHTLEITRFAPPGIEDVSERDGHLYSNKAPGGALVGLPGYALARIFTAAIRPTMDAMRLFAATIPALLLAIAFVAIARRLGATDERAHTATIALLFGTPLFAYGLLNFSHALAAAALFGAWALLDHQEQQQLPSPRLRGEGQARSARVRGGKLPILAGALLGLAVLSEYPCAAPALVLIACARPRTWWKLALGGLPFAILLGAYNQLAFGSWHTLSSGHERYAQFREMAAHGVFGVGIPNPLTLLRLIADPARGLFVFSPVLLLALEAIPAARRALPPRAFWSLVLAPLALVLLYSGYPNWHGGWTAGGRYLVPALPFLALLLLFRAPTRLESFLLGASIAAVALTSLIFPFVPPDFPAPWGTFALPLLRHGLVIPNLAHFVARPLAIALPFALVVAATARKDVAMFAGVVVMIVVGALVPVAPLQRVERGYIAEVFFERDGAIVAEGVRVPPEFLRRSDAQRTTPPPPWPF